MKCPKVVEGSMRFGEIHMHIQPTQYLATPAHPLQLRAKAISFSMKLR